jgi:NADPH-dependent glutamate synthase beta subunit-like oxidoreductase
LGSGPAGLTVAYELSKNGYPVTVFESLPEAGGMLKKCIPEFRLPKKVFDREINFIKDMGVEVKTSVEIGKDVGLEELQEEGYNAVFVGTGAHNSQGLKVEGKDFDGVVDALDFLWGSKCGRKMDSSKNVVVIGGGNVAVDAARVALRQGAEGVTILYRRSREEMPANPYEVREAEDEGVKIEFLASPKRILGEKGRVSAIECVRMQLGESDETGRRRASPVDGSEFTRQTGMVILAIGEAPDLRFLPKQVEKNDDGTVWVNPITMETSMPGVFAGGDAVAGPASVIEAIRDGKRAAESIESYLKATGKVRR